MAMRDGVGALAVRCGVNLGPVRLVKDLNAQMNIIGDGINVAQRVMSFARPGQLLVSRSFYEVVSCLSRDYANLFNHEGARTDKHVREHDVYSVVGGTPTSRRLGDTISDAFEGEAAPGWFTRSGPLGLRRSAMVAAAVVFFAIVAGGVAARTLMEPGAEPVPATASRAASAPAGAAAKPEVAPSKKILTRAEKRPEGRGPVPDGAGRIELAVAPWGEVLVDGKSRGVSPPLRTLDLPPGAHTVEIRNSTFAAYVEQVEVKPGEAVKIRHRFR
jgi:hypothetical protein